MVETNPTNVEEALRGLYHASMNLPNAASHCGMTQREMKMAFREFIKYNPPCYNINEQLVLPI